MPRLNSVGCDETWFLGFARVGLEDSNTPEETDGSFTCTECKSSNVFHIKRGAVTSPGRLFENEVKGAVAAQVKASVSEAQLAFYGHAYRAAAGMCRVALEESLPDKGIGTNANKLEKCIELAKDKGIFGDEQVTFATASRLIGNQALHRQRAVLQ